MWALPRYAGNTTYPGHHGDIGQKGGWIQGKTDPLAHINTIYRHIKKLDGYEVAKSRYGAAYANYKYRVIGKGKEPTRPMEVVQIDHTTLDLFIVDSQAKRLLNVCRRKSCH